jgi:hypothetical protein
MHASDCAVHNAPSLPKGPCDCGAADLSEAVSSLLAQWLEMCCTNDEFIRHYNRLYRAQVDFRPKMRTPFESMVDKACGHKPGIVIPESADNRAFLDHCVDLFTRIQFGKAQPAQAQE